MKPLYLVFAFFLILAGCLGIGLCFLEVGLRVKARLASVQKPSDEGMTRGGGNEAPIFDRHPYLIVYNKTGMREVAVTTNSRGFRGTREFSASKPEGTKRILVMGGSAAVGMRASSDGATISARLEAILSKKFPQVEVINAACAGFNSVQDLILLATDLLSLQADVVLVYGGGTDFNTSMSEKWYPGYHELQDVLVSQSFHSFLEHSQAYVFLKSFVPVRPIPKEGVLHPEAVSVYLENVRRMARLTTASGARFIAVLQPALEVSTKPRLGTEPVLVVQAVSRGGLPSNYPVLIRQLYQEASRLLPVKAWPVGAYFLDHSDIFARTHEEVFSDAFHLNDRGYRLEAERLAKFILEKKLL